MLSLDINLQIAVVALVIDALTGDPAWLYRRLPHPVAIVGNVIARVDERTNRGQGAARELVAGLFAVVFLVAAVAALGILLETWLSGYRFGWIVEAIMVSTLIAFRGLYDGVKAVAGALDEGLEPAREAVSHLVGRDPKTLDEAGVARAAVESAAENFSDGVVAPVFWFLLLGLPGLFACKTINTLDSMLGHRSPRHEHFGKAAARIDDLVNWLPARLTALLVALAALAVPGASAGHALRTAWRDAGKHRSVNAGWPEAAFAGALGLALAGPRRYEGAIVEDAWMGDGRSELSGTDIHGALRLYVTAAALLLAGLVAARLGWPVP